MKLKAQAIEDAIRRPLESSSGFLRTCSGLISRHVLHFSEAGVWIDQVVWDDMSSALQAASQFGKAPEVAEFASLLDTSDMRKMQLTSFYQSADL